MGGTMVIIAYITFVAAVLLLYLHFYIPEATTLEIVRKVAGPMVSVEGIHYIGNAEDWTIVSFYTPKVFDWLKGRVELSEVDKAACQQLRDRLETSVQWIDMDYQAYEGVPREKYEAISIMNNKTDKTLIVSWKDNDVIAGTWIDFGAYSEYIPIEDFN